MELNHETAMRLWTKSFGKTINTIDFAGRRIYKGAYNDRDSEYGWNVDHIYPESKGGKTTDSNLICCHITTNDEKADSFPTFNANGHKFQIKKFQNHYEISPLQPITNYQNNQFNFFDFADGIRFIDKQCKLQDDEIYIGTIIIGLQNIHNHSIVDFIERVFENHNIYYKSNYIIVKNYNIRKVKMFWDLLNDCKLLYTYLKHYFLPLRFVSAFFITLKLEHSCKIKKINSGNDDLNHICYNNKFCINELAKCNIPNEEEVSNNMPYYSFHDNYYDYIADFKQLAKNLDKEVREE